MVALRAACDGEPGVVLTLLISRLFRFSVAAVVPVGLWATLLCCPQIHRLARAEDCGHAQPAWREVRTWRIGEAGTAPTSTAKSRIDAVPHTVLSTHAGAVFQSLLIASRFTAHKAVHRRRGAMPSARPGGATRPAAAVG